MNKRTALSGPETSLASPIRVAEFHRELSGGSYIEPPSQPDNSWSSCLLSAKLAGTAAFAMLTGR